MKECQYCKIYHEAPAQYRNNTIETRSINESRWCTKVKAYVDSEATGCSVFDIAKHFWCIRGNEWNYFPVCLSKQNKKEKPCVHCSQGRNIISVLRGIPSNNKPTLNRLPKLIRRPSLLKQR